jgi:hypothetical protein
MSRVQPLEFLSGGLESVETPLTDYAAVPLDLSVDDEHYCPYTRDSLDRINRRVNDAFDNAARNGWVSSLESELAKQLKLLVQESLVTSHRERIERNRTNDAARFIDMNDPAVERAMKGVATPLELLYVLEEYPKIETVELAKLSHPLDASATRTMNEAMRTALITLGEDVDLGEPRYKRKSSREDIPAVVVLRKQPISEYDTKHGRIQVVQRAAYLTRGDEEAAVSPFLDRKIRNPERIKELGQKVEAYLPHIHENFKWLQPIATSYYAKYLTGRKV